MKIGIISDTHDQIERVKKAVDVFNQERVEMVIHCGDIVSPFMLQYFKELKCPIKFLFGNNTGDVFLHLKYSGEFGLPDHEFGTFFAMELAGKKIAVYHGDHKEITAALVKCGNYDCVFTGHDHLSRIEQAGQVLLVNPGTLVDRHKPGMSRPSIAIYNAISHTAQIIEITG
jgi:uncharacterized protein